MIAILVLGSVIALGNLKPREVVIDTTDAETIYAVGANWKARFRADGAEFTPFLGADAPRNEFVRFDASRVTLDGVALASNAEAGVQRAGHTLRYARGAFDEVFEARPEGLEHKWTFTELPVRGELVVRCPVESSLSAREAQDGIEFTNERGGVRYPSAIAFDAAGRRVTLPVRLDGGSLVLTVPEAFVESAALPLTIDPLIQVFGVSTGPTYDFAADCAYQYVGMPQGPSRCEVWETAWSLTDHDITARVTSIQSGAGTTFLIDATSEYWSQPKVASLVVTSITFTSKFLVVAAAGLPTSGARSIQGREITAAPSTLTLGAITPIGAGVVGDNHHPDVGGDPWSQGGATFSTFCIVWQSDQPTGDSDVHAALFPYALAPTGKLWNVGENPTTDDENPRITKSNGTGVWCVVWERRVTPGNRDIWANTVSYSVFPGAPILISAAPEDESNPSVSTTLVGAPAGRLIFAYERDMGGQRDVFLQTCLTLALTPAGPAINFTQLEGGTHLGLDQRFPVVDGTVNTGHLLAYRDDDPLDPSLKRTRITSFELTPAPAYQVVLHEVRHSLGNPGLGDSAPSVCCHDAAGALGGGFRWEVVWDEVPSVGDSDVFGATFSGLPAGPVQLACYGDGSITACPCAQNGGAPAGCPSSSQATGGELQWTGQANVSTNNFVVNGLRLSANAPALLTGGSVLVPGGIVFGDGLLCLSGTLTRLAVRITDAAGALTYPATGSDPSIATAGGVPPAGGLQVYQLVYRDSASFCTAGTFNTTNALIVIWAP